jgi:hypothetical protein
MEAFAEKLDEVKGKEDHKHDEKFVEHQLEKNLMIINTFEEFYERKISPEELKEINESLKDAKIPSTQQVKSAIESFKQKHDRDTKEDHEKPPSSSKVSTEHFAELQEISSRLSSIVQDLQTRVKFPNRTSISPTQKSTDAKTPKVESFVQGNEPYTHLNKYMPLF